jgi:hypothetical protein
LTLSGAVRLERVREIPQPRIAMQRKDRNVDAGVGGDLHATERHRGFRLARNGRGRRTKTKPHGLVNNLPAER